MHSFPILEFFLKFVFFLIWTYFLHSTIWLFSNLFWNIFHLLKEKVQISCSKICISHFTNQSFLVRVIISVSTGTFFSCSRLILHLYMIEINIFQICRWNWSILDLLLRNKIENFSESLSYLSVSAWCVQWVIQLRVEKKCILENSSNFRYWIWRW